MGSFGLGSGYAPLGYEASSSWAAPGLSPAESTTHAGSGPRGPRLVFVSGPCDQNPKSQMPDWIVIHPKKATATTRYAMYLPKMAVSNM